MAISETIGYGLNHLMARASDPVHTDITDVSKAFAVLGFFITCYGLMSYVVKERLYLSEPLIALTVGIVTGPYVLGWVDPLSWADEETTNFMTYQFTRLVIGVQVLFCGISLPARYLRRNGLSLTVLLIFVMTCAWFISALLIWGLIPGLSFLESLCLAAAVTPTDPVLANSITKGRFAEKHVPANVRNILVAESGANDGLGFPFIYLAIYLIQRLPGGEDEGLSVGQEIGRWIYAGIIYQIGVSIAYGFLIGFVARKSLKWAESRGYIDKDSFFAYGLGLALFVLGTTGLFGSDDILAAFIAGNSFTWDDWFRLRTEENDTQDILDMLLNAAVFIYIGAIIDWKQYVPGNNTLELNAWRVVVLSMLILLLRRPPSVMALHRFIPALTNLKEAAFAGWFGPIGVSAVFYIQVALRDLPEASERLRAIYAPVTLFVVFSSVLMHGVTVPVSKLGPGLLRHTTTLTKTRSITFTSRPGSRTQTMTGEEEKNNGERVPWNPLLSLWEGLLHVVLFWRKDSFWRRPPKSTPEGIKGLTISGPRDGHAQSIIEPKSGEGEERTPSNTSDDTTDSEGGPKGARLPPAPLELPTTHGSNGHATSQRPQTPTAAHPQASRIGHLVREFEHALNHELSAERQEAQEEAAEGWSAEIKAAMRAQKAVEEAEKAGGGGGGGTGPSTPLRNTANQGILENRSAPGTPGQRSIRFGGATSEDLLKTAVSRMRDREADQ